MMILPGEEAASVRLFVSALAFIGMLLPTASVSQESANSQRTIPDCRAVPSDHKLVGWGKYGLFFSVPKRGVKILGKPDVDYLRLVIRPDQRNFSLVFWFGPYAFNREPDEGILRASTSVARIKLTTPDGTDIGVDSSGKKHDGTLWRHFAVGLEGAEYEKVPATEATLFDQIIESACLNPYPR